MLNQLKEAYREINLEDKRNELNKEILSLLMLMNVENEFYNYVKGSNISEDEYLTETYMQVVELRKNILKLINDK